MIVYYLFGKHFPRSCEHEILVPLSIVGVWRNNHKVDECTRHVTLFVQALSLELALIYMRGTLSSSNGKDCRSGMF